MTTYMCWVADGCHGPDDAAPYEDYYESYAAEACAERDHENSAGEGDYPVDVHVTGPDGIEQVFSVDIEYTVSFSADLKCSALLP